MAKRVELTDSILRRIHYAEHEGWYIHELAKMYHVVPRRLRIALDDWRIRNNKSKPVTMSELHAAASRVLPKCKRGG